MPALTSSNSYSTYAEYVDYCDLTGRTPVEQTLIEPSLIQATLSLDRKYGGRFIGRKQSATQPLQWPRSPVGSRTIDTPDGLFFTDADGNYRNFNEVPVEVKQATCEIALGILDGNDLLSQESPTVTEETVQLDVISTTTKYNAAYQSKTPMTYLTDVILRPLLAPTATTIKFVV